MKHKVFPRGSVALRVQEIVDLQVKTFAYWKTMKKRLIGAIDSQLLTPRADDLYVWPLPSPRADYVQMATRSKLCTDLIERQLKRALVTPVETAHSARELMAPDDAIGRERVQLSKRMAALRTAEGLLKQVPTDIGALCATPFAPPSELSAEIDAALLPTWHNDEREAEDEAGRSPERMRFEAGVAPPHATPATKGKKPRQRRLNLSGIW